MSSLSPARLALEPPALSGHRVPWMRLVVVVWALALLAVFAAIWRYKTTPGSSTEPPAAWPADVPLSRVNDQATIVICLLYTSPSPRD